jgi:hypothetical protein
MFLTTNLETNMTNTDMDTAGGHLRINIDVLSGQQHEILIIRHAGNKNAMMRSRLQQFL